LNYGLKKRKNYLLVDRKIELTPPLEGNIIFQDNVVAAAIIDRIVHHAKIFYINSASYRLKNKLKNKNL